MHGLRLDMYGCLFCGCTGVGGTGVQRQYLLLQQHRDEMEVSCMELLQEYSSNSEPEADPSDAEEQQIVEPAPNIIDYNLYLENYSNQHNMGSGFAHIPWRPTHNTLINLKKMCTESMNKIKTAYPDVYGKYDWNIYGVPMYSVENKGKLALTHLQSVRDHHITLFPNIRGENYKIDQLIDNVRYQITEKFTVPPGLITTKSEKAKSLDSFHKILFKNQVPDSIKQNVTYKKMIQLKLENNIQLLKNGNGSNMFLAATIDLKAPQQRDFFKALQAILLENTKLLNLTVSDKGNQSLDELLSSKYQIFHVSLVLAELRNLNQRIDHQDFLKLKKFVSSPGFVGKKSINDIIEVNVEALAIDILTLNRQHHEVKFVL